MHFSFSMFIFDFVLHANVDQTITFDQMLAFVRWY